MAYLLLAVGALMSLAGAYLAISGYRIVQIEEGWSLVIAGSTLFVGGFLMMGLGLVLRALTQIRSAFAVRGLAAETPAATALPAAPPATAPRKIEPAVEDRLRPEMPLRPPPTLPVSNAPPPLMPAGPAVAPPPLSLSDIAAAAEQTPAPSHDETQESRESDETYARALEDAAADDHYELETPSTPEHDLVSMHPTPAPTPPPLVRTPPPVPPAPARPAVSPAKPVVDEPALSDDWLDRAFAEFDQGLPQRPPSPIEPVPPPKPRLFETRDNATPVAPTPAPEPVPAPVEPVASALVADDIAPPTPAAPPPLPAGARATVDPAPRPSGPSATVIGRYESDGTAYVMYADGSIEAHSDAGLFRFASMAELKASFEN